VKIHYSKQATKYIQKLDKPAKLRISDYRIIFTITGEILSVEKIKSRGDVY